MNSKTIFAYKLGAAVSLLAIVLWLALTFTAQPSRKDVLAAMKKATVFMSEKVAVHGGYVWFVSEDLSRRWGEMPARPSQIWLQGGTEHVGEVLLDAYEITQDEYYLNAARNAVDAIVFGQHPLGGWHYFIDFDPEGISEWYKTVATRYRWGFEEYRYYYGNATYDDHVTQNASKFLLRFYNLTQDEAYREPVLKSLEFVLMSQYPNGAWPQRFPLRYDYSHNGFPDYTSYYTLNDGAMQANIELLLEAHETLGDPRYFESAQRGVDALIALQGPADQAAWAEQYGPDMKPIAARTHEPAGYVVRESIEVLFLLARFYLITGDTRYLEPVPLCLDWFDRINRESAVEKYPRPRYWEPGTNRPLYVVRTDDLTPEGYGKYLWTTDPAKTDCDNKPCKGDNKPLVNVAELHKWYNEIVALTTPEARTAFLTKMFAHETRQSRGDKNISDLIAALDSRGAWVTDNTVFKPNATSEIDMRETLRGISTRVFVNRMSTLIATLRNNE